MKLNSLFNSNKENLSFLIDVGNGTITAGIVSVKKESKPEFIYITKRFFASNEKLDAKKLKLEMLSLLDEVLNNLSNEGLKNREFAGKRINGVLLSLSSPWFISRTKHLNLINEKEFVITNNFLEDLLKNEIKLLKDELSKQEGEEELEIVEKNVVHSKINGYFVDELIGKRTKKLEASVYMSLAPKDFVEKILEIIHKHTHINRNYILVNTFPLIGFTVIRDLFTHESEFMFMDISSEITDISLIKNDVIEKSVSIPSGKNFILRQITKTLNISIEIASSTLKLFSENKLDEENTKKIENILISVEKEWSIYLEDALTQLSENSLPSNLFLTTDEDVSEIYIKFLSLAKNDSTENFRKNLKITHLDLDKLKSFYENRSGYLLNEFIVLISLFYKKILDK